MIRSPHHLSIAFLVGLTVAAAPPAAAQTTTVLVVRHAEKDAGDDPGLVPLGEERAIALSGVVTSGGVDAVYSTPFERTRQTAGPTAERFGIPVQLVEPTESLEQHVRQVAEKVLADHRGETVLVVGHSNTVPAILSALGVEEVPPLTEEDYGDLFIVIVDATGDVRSLQARYGPAEQTGS